MSPVRAVLRAVLLAGTGIALLLGCSGGGGAGGDTATSRGTTVSATSPAGSAPTTEGSKPSAPPSPSTSPAPRPALLTIPAIGVEELRVVPYEGTTDDRAGTRIQSRGVAANPYGERGGVGPGEVGNYLVTAHRLSSGGPLRRLPDLDEGDSVLVTVGGAVHEYEITGTRKTSFRSARSLAEQRAAVPGFPGRRPTQAMITISTCLTLEDDAAGNFWRDENGNPEHRVDKIGVLTGTRTPEPD
ncbi:class E sortase [Streptomyces sp. S.PB5]|uniref:class E sortase n=1 Tax=Streptomyces sp. S.PB5 TaxID=3020844 RepID=UPI0025B17794|nr:class E sortase [Streptomyces sp. S.PB5]MDN3024003.1 class E sortase [Streptomyces sp. S.PB5]